MTVSNADIVSRLKLLADEHLKADSGDLVSVTCSALIDLADISNQFICFVSGANIGLDRVINTFTPSTGVVTFDTLATAMTNIDEFCIVKTGFQSDVAQAEQAIRNDLRNSGHDLDLFLTEPQLKEMYIYKTIELICAGLMNDAQDQDVYFANYTRFQDLYNGERTSLIADYDVNQNGSIDDEEEVLNVGQVRFAR